MFYVCSCNFCFSCFLIWISFLLLFKDIDFNKMFDGEIGLPDSATANTILQNKRYFSNLNLIKANVIPMLGPVNLIEDT